MIDLNKLCKVTLANATQRMNNGANINVDTYHMLKHCATEVVEAVEAWTKYQDNCECELDGNFDYTIYDLREKSKFHFSSELADIICCVLIIAGKENIDIEQAINNCIEKNRKRAEKVGDKL